MIQIAVSRVIDEMEVENEHNNIVPMFNSQHDTLKLYPIFVQQQLSTPSITTQSHYQRNSKLNERKGSIL